MNLQTKGSLERVIQIAVDIVDDSFNVSLGQVEFALVIIGVGLVVENGQYQLSVY